MSNEPLPKEKTHWASIVCLCFGIASIFLWDFNLVPLLAIAFGIYAAFRTKREQWQMWLGLALGLLFLVVAVYHNSQAKSWVPGVIPLHLMAAASSGAPAQTSAVPSPQTPAEPIQPQALPVDKTLLLALTNKARLPTVPPVYDDSTLDTLAQTRATHLCAIDQWSHANWEDSFVGSEYVWHGENLEKGTSSMTKAEADFLASPPHRANIMNPHFTNMGIGYAPACELTVELFGG